MTKSRKIQRWRESAILSPEEVVRIIKAEPARLKIALRFLAEIGRRPVENDLLESPSDGARERARRRKS